MKSIHTLIPDVQELLERKDGWFTDELARALSDDTALRLKAQLGQQEARPHLRLSQMGDRCPRALWYSIHQPHLAEPLPPWATFKYSFGHVVEALAVTLAKAAGHTVTGEQDVLELDGVKGHRDCVIDGCIVDVKSASSLSYADFKNKNITSTYALGYLAQLDGYMVASNDDSLVINKDQGYLWVIDKQLGHMCLYEHNKRENFIRERIRDYKAIVSLSEPPRCTCKTVSDGESGNIALGSDASYSQFKFSCFPQLRCFLYARGPKYLTTVVKRPENRNGPIPEVDRNGKLVYN